MTKTTSGKPGCVWKHPTTACSWAVRAQQSLKEVDTAYLKKNPCTIEHSVSCKDCDTDSVYKEGREGERKGRKLSSNAQALSVTECVSFDVGMAPRMLLALPKGICSVFASFSADVAFLTVGYLSLFSLDQAMLCSPWETLVCGSFSSRERLESHTVGYPFCPRRQWMQTWLHSGFVVVVV